MAGLAGTFVLEDVLEHRALATVVA